MHTSPSPYVVNISLLFCFLEEDRHSAAEERKNIFEADTAIHGELLHEHAQNTNGPSPQRGNGPPPILYPTRSVIQTGSAYTLNEDPQPQVDFTWGFSNLKPAASSVST
jgi:hypothetical protein